MSKKVLNCFNQSLPNNKGNLPKNSHEAAVLAHNFRLIHVPQRFRLDRSRVSWLSLILDRFKTQIYLINNFFCLTFLNANWDRNPRVFALIRPSEKKRRKIPHELTQLFSLTWHHLMRLQRITIIFILGFAIVADKQALSEALTINRR